MGNIAFQYRMEAIVREVGAHPLRIFERSFKQCFLHTVSIFVIKSGVFFAFKIVSLESRASMNKFRGQYFSHSIWLAIHKMLLVNYLVIIAGMEAEKINLPGKYIAKPIAKQRGIAIGYECFVQGGMNFAGSRHKRSFQFLAAG